MTEIPQTLRGRREELGMSQRALAEALGTQQSHVCEMEQRTDLPGPDLLTRWADALGFDVEVRLIDRGDAR